MHLEKESSLVHFHHVTTKSWEVLNSQNQKVLRIGCYIRVCVCVYIYKSIIGYTYNCITHVDSSISDLISSYHEKIFVCKFTDKEIAHR